MKMRQRYYDLILKGGVGLMLVAASVWLAYETWRFFLEPEQLGGIPVHPGALDLKFRYAEVQAWFSHEKTHGVHLTYPPASYALLGIVLWWLDLGQAKIVWWLASILALAWLSRQLVRYSLAETVWERRFIALIPFAVYATGAAIGNGQLSVLVLPLVLCSVVLTCGHAAPSGKSWLGSLAMLVALVQPTIAAPFFWLVMFVRGKIKHPALVVGGYLFLTGFAVAFQAAQTDDQLSTGPFMQSVLVSLDTWSDRAVAGATSGARTGAYANVHTLLTRNGLGYWNMQASVTILLLLGVWIFLHRKVDLWLLIGVTAVVARLWVYHRWYDDLLLVLPLIPLFRITRSGSYTSRVKSVAWGLMALLVTLSIAPGGHFLLPMPWVEIYIYALIGCWGGVLAFLAFLAHRERRSPASNHPGQGWA